MQKKQDGKTPLLRYVDERLVTKLDQELKDWVKLQKEIIKNLTISDIIAQEVWSTFQHVLFRNMLTESGSHLGTEYHYPSLYDILLVPFKQETTMWYNDGADVTAQSKNYFFREILNIATKKQDEASKRFGMAEPKPKSVAEAGEWLRAGKFRLGHDRTEASLSDVEFYASYQISDWITWVDPTVVRDEDSYNQYMSRLSTETKHIERLIVACHLSDTDYDYSRDGSSDFNIVIDAIEELEGWDWTPPAKVIPPVSLSSVPTLLSSVGDDTAQAHAA